MMGLPAGNLGKIGGESHWLDSEVSKSNLHLVLTISLEPIEARISSPPPPTKRILYCTIRNDVYGNSDVRLPAVRASLHGWRVLSLGGRELGPHPVDV